MDEDEWASRPDDQGRTLRLRAQPDGTVAAIITNGHEGSVATTLTMDERWPAARLLAAMDDDRVTIPRDQAVLALTAAVAMMAPPHAPAPPQLSVAAAYKLADLDDQLGTGLGLRRELDAQQTRRTPEEKRAFSRAWDERVKRGQERERDEDART